VQIPAARGVIDHLNERLAVCGLLYRIDEMTVLPYVSPMWLANWSVPQLDDMERRPSGVPQKTDGPRRGNRHQEVRAAERHLARRALRYIHFDSQSHTSPYQ
jgi:hypothetical protein